MLDSTRGADVVDAVVSDVDGDGVDDVVYTTVAGNGREYDGFRVLRLDGPGAGSSEGWAPTPRCPAGGCSFYLQEATDRGPTAGAEFATPPGVARFRP